MTRFTDIDLARLPALPKTALTMAAYRDAYLADLAARLAAKGILYDVQSIEGDTYSKTGEAFSFRTLLVATSIDDAVAAVLLPTSYGSYLDALGAGQLPPVKRQPLVDSPRPYVPNTEAADDWQSDDVFRALIQLAPESLSPYGPEGPYVFFASEVPEVKAVAAYGPMSFGGTLPNPFTGLGEARVPIVSTIADGTASPALVASVQSAIRRKDRFPIADFPQAMAATILTYALDVRLRIGSGADPEIIGLAALGRLRAVADFQHKPGGQVLQQDLYAAAKVPDPKGSPIVPLVDLGGFGDLNAVPITPATPAAAYCAPYCLAGVGDPVVSSTDDATVYTSGGITVRVEVVDD